MPISRDFFILGARAGGHSRSKSGSFERAISSNDSLCYGWTSLVDILISIVVCCSLRCVHESVSFASFPDIFSPLSSTINVGSGCCMARFSSSHLLLQGGMVFLSTRSRCFFMPHQGTSLAMLYFLCHNLFSYTTSHLMKITLAFSGF